MSNRPAARPGCTRWKPCDEDPRRSLALAPAFYTLVTCGAFTAEGEFLDVPERDLGRLETDWQEAVFALYLAEEKVTPRGGREPAELAAQRLQCRPAGVPAGGRPGWHRASGWLHDPLPLQPLAVGQGDRDRASRLQGRKGRLPEVPGRDEGDRLHRAAAGRRDREDPPPLWAVALLKGTAGRRRFRPRRSRGHSQAARDEPRELVFVADRVTCAEAEGFLDADAFAHDPADQWYRRPREAEPRELTCVDEDTFWSEF